VSERGFYCHACQAKGGLKKLAQELNILPGKERGDDTQRKIVRTYDYRDETGSLLFQVVRYNPKKFKQRRSDGNGGWLWDLNGTRRVLYRLPELTASLDNPVWIVEGEKDADRLAKEGLLATTNSGGADKWRPAYNQCLRDRDIIIIPDNDEAGKRHAHTVARSLTGTAKSVKIVHIPNLPHKGDVTGWLDAGHSIEDLQKLAAMTPECNHKELDENTSTHASNPPHLVREAVDDPHRLARVYLEHYGMDDQERVTIRFWRDQWWRWTGTHYQSLEKSDLRAELTTATKIEFNRWADEDHSAQDVRKVTHHLITDVLQALSGLVLVSADIEQPAWLRDTNRHIEYLSMQNGLVDLHAVTSGQSANPIPHTPEWFSIIHLPYPFKPTAASPRWLRFLNEILEEDEDRIAVLQEWFGYCLTADTSMQKFLMLEGDGANGKSVVCDILTALLGAENVSHVPLELFGQRFQLTQTLNRLANIAAEIGELDKAAEGTLKAFTSGDRMHFDRKGIPCIEAYPTARLVFSTNNRPRFSDRSTGLWRRMILVPFRQTIPEGQQDVRLTDRLRQELPGIFCWAVEGLRRLREQGRFTTAELCTEAVEEYRIDSNPARQFLSEYVKEAPEDVVPCKQLYRKYRHWCNEFGYRPLSDRTFGKEVFRLFPRTRRRRIGGRQDREWHYDGITVSYVSHVSYVSIPG